MFPFKSILSSVIIAVLCASASSAASSPVVAKHTHRIRELSSGVTLQTYHPASTYETYGAGIDHPLSKRSDASSEDSAVAFVQSRGIAASAIHVGSLYASDTAQHVYLKQQANGIPIANAVANVALNKDNKVVAYGSSFVNATSIASSLPSVSVQDAVATAESQLSVTYDASQYPAPQLQYFSKDDGSVVLTHTFIVTNTTAATYYQAFVDAHSGDLVSVTDFVSKASYYALQIPKQAPPEGLGTIADPQNYASSPYGWHSTDNVTISNQTAGNNAFAGDNGGTPSVESGANDIFDYEADFTIAPNVSPNVDAARVNTFYMVNSVHDITYQYGFTETAYNFQSNNFGKGGAQGDRVQIIAQSTLGTDDSAFVTMPDGLQGIMYMFLWDYTNPERDGSLENDIISHENTHGMTQRMTGGGTANCLGPLESGGLGEGWSDAFADWLLKNDSSVPDFVLGAYVLNNTAGIRHYPYSTNATTNPLTYSALQTLDEVHDIGEVWANTLHNVYAALVEKHGWSDTARTDATGSEGNVVHLHLFIDALAIQPCNPTFVDARAAWIQADQNRYGGANNCTLWNAFASKGLGVNAANYTDDFTVPDGC